MMLLVDPVRRMEVIRALHRRPAHYTCHFTRHGTKDGRSFSRRRPQARRAQLLAQTILKMKPDSTPEAPLRGWTSRNSGGGAAEIRVTDGKPVDALVTSQPSVPE